MKIIGYATTTIILILISTFWGGFVLSRLWEWFIVTAIHAPHISTLQAIGLRAFVSFLWDKPTTKKDERSYSDQLIQGTAYAVLFPAMALGIGAIIHSFY